ncbi:hypothetical protein C5167_037023 [Papaver somniferum]|uniref:Uncharacterized protein n=1 Tax=Papaver somniferum TaxID=3469 RepID=A0A4Y7I5K8_PAPSO|nr:hypothetical protein C5167_037023 [Papaver somniferum]
MKMLYEEMTRKVELVMEQGFVDDDMLNSEKEHQFFVQWKVTDGFTRQNHPTLIQKISQN